jgi:hypothetical protein
MDVTAILGSVVGVLVIGLIAMVLRGARGPAKR